MSTQILPEQKTEGGEDFMTWKKTEPKPAIIYTNKEDVKWNLEGMARLERNELMQLHNNVILSTLQSTFVLRSKNTEELTERLDLKWAELVIFLDNLFLSNPAILNTMSKKLIRDSLKGVANLKSIFQRNAQIAYLDNIVNSVKETI